MRGYIAGLLSLIALSSASQITYSSISTGSLDNGRTSFSEDGQFLGVLSGKNTLNIFKAESELLTNSIEVKEFNEIYELAFGKKNECFIGGKDGNKHKIMKADLATGEYTALVNSENQITGMFAIPNKSILIYSNADGYVISANTDTGETIWTQKGHSKFALDVTYSRETKLIASSGSDGKVVVFSLEGELVKEIPLVKDWVQEVCFSHSGATIIAGTENGELYEIFPEANYNSEKIPIERMRGNVTEIALAPDDESVLVSSLKGDVVIWSFKENKELRRYKIKGAVDVRGAVFNPNGKVVYVASSGSKNIISYDVSVLRIIPKFRFKDEDDKTAPLIYISEPANLASGTVTFSESLLKIVGSAIDESGIHMIKLNGRETKINENGNFVMYMPLQMGDNFVTIEVQDINDNTTVKRFTVKRKNLDGEEYDPVDAKNYLFIVGINRYQYWPQLFNAVRDAEDVLNTLVSMYDFSFSNVKMLLDEQASLNNIYVELTKYVEQIGPQDNLVVYYSGHGHYDQLLNEGYWVPFDAKVDAPGEYLSNSNLLKVINSINSQHTFMVVDACFSGSLFAPSTRGYTDNVEKYKSRWGLASGRLETVSDGAYGENSPFANKFIEFLKTNEKEEFPVSELVQIVKVKVADESNQTPIGNPLKSVGDEGGEFIFRKKN